MPSGPRCNNCVEVNNQQKKRVDKKFGDFPFLLLFVVLVKLTDYDSENDQSDHPHYYHHFKIL